MRARACLGAALLAAGAAASAAQVVIPAGASITLPPTVVQLACADLTVQGTFSPGASTVFGARNITIAAGGTLDAGSASLRLGGDWTNAGTFVRGTSTVALVDACATGPAHIVGSNAFATLSFESATGRTLVLPAGNATSVSTQLYLLGAGGGPPIQVISSNPLVPTSIALDAGAGAAIANVQYGTNVAVVPADLQAAPATLAFGGQSMRTTAPAKSVSITNAGINPVTFDSIAASAPYAVTHDCTTVVPGASCAAQVTFTPTAEGPLVGALTIQTSTGTRVVDLSGTGERSLVTHYYRSILRRAPDAGGKAFWEAEAARMQSIGANVNEAWFAMAQFFYFSAEYLALNRDDAQFVTDLYTTFFNRAPDAGGLAFWAGLVAQGMPREVVLASFMFSAEFGAFTQAIFGNTAARAEVDVVMDFYRGLLARLPDPGGFTHWVGQFRAAQCAGGVPDKVESISSQFASGAEYLGRNRTDAQFVGDLYNAFLRRGGDLGGVQFWINELGSGARTRENVRVQFRDSAEFQSRAAAIVAQGCLP